MNFFKFWALRSGRIPYAFQLNEYIRVQVAEIE